MICRKMKHEMPERLTGFIFGLLLMLLASGAAISASAVSVEAAASGFTIVTESGKRVCYYYKNGAKVKNAWVSVNGKKYFFDSKGHQVTGWQNGTSSSVKRFFFTTLGQKGYMATGFVAESSGKVRYFDTKSGNMARGWKSISGSYRYFDTKTGELYVGYRRIGQYYYFLRNNTDIKKRGIRYQAGWYTSGGTRFYFSKRDGHAQVGWLTLDGKKYYFDTKGHLYVNKTFKVSGRSYKADKNGVVTVVRTAQPAPAIAATYTARKTFTYANHGSYVTVYDSTNGRYYNMVSQFLTDYGVASGASTDRDILAALCEAEAGDQGLIGMEAVAMCILNRTIKADKEFPSEVRLVIYQTNPRQYSTTVAAVNQRLSGNWYNKTLAYQAADEAMKIFTAYRTKGTARVISGFYGNQDVPFMYFMMNYAFSSSYSRGGFRYVYRDHTFFVDWA